MSDKIDLEGNKVIPVSAPIPTSTNVTIVTMEMIIRSVEIGDDGNTKVNYYVSFTSGNGHHLLYPWEELKETVLKWCEVEKGGT
jgi:hypothetical protein